MNMPLFRYNDYKDSGKIKNMTLTGIEFIRRFLMHILPAGFVKIRHYGILAGRNRPTKPALLKRLMNIIPSRKSNSFTTLEFLEKFMELDFSTCSKCPLVSAEKLALTYPTLTLTGAG